MEILFQPGEAIFLTFKTANGSGWLTSHRLILCEHPSGHLEGREPKDYWLKNLADAQINNSTLTAEFKDKKVKIQLPTCNSTMLEEIKNYIVAARVIGKNRIS